MRGISLLLTLASLLAALVMAEPAATQTMAPHGFWVIGEGPIYLSHKPMFNSTMHGFQVIVEVDLAGPAKGPAGKGQQPLALYTSARNPSTPPPPANFTLKAVGPNGGLFPLARLRTPGFRFQGALFTNNFEKPSTKPVKIAEGFDVVVKNALVFETLLPTGGAGTIKAFLFGVPGGEIFLANRIDRTADFDQVVQVRSGASLPVQAGKAVEVELPGLTFPAGGKQARAFKPPQATRFRGPSGPPVPVQLDKSQFHTISPDFI